MRRHAARPKGRRTHARRVISIDSCTIPPKRDATIGFMAKFKLVRAKSARAAAPKAGLPCLILVLLIMALVMLFLYFAMKGFTPSQ